MTLAGARPRAYLTGMSVAARLHDLTVLDLTGQPVAMGTLWRDQPVLLVYIRHYG